MAKKQRSNEMLLVGYYLARCGDGSHPPRALNVKDWNRAYAMFYGELGEGRVLSVFKNSLKNVRDEFDAHVDSPRVGWKPGEPARQRAKEILEEYGRVSDEELANMLKPYIDMEVANVSKETLAVAYAELSPTQSMIEAKTEGGQKVYISVAREKRNLSLRDPAIQFHGTSCVACGFDFGEAYGEWGKGGDVVTNTRISDRMLRYPSGPTHELCERALKGARSVSDTARGISSSDVFRHMANPT